MFEGLGYDLSAKKTLYKDACLADAKSPELRVGVSILVANGIIEWVKPVGDELPISGDTKTIDAGGATIVPGLVDCHAHLPLQGGSHWVERIKDPTDRLLEEAEVNGELLDRAGIRWVRDVGSPVRPDPLAGRDRGLSLRIKDAWRDRLDRPRVRGAGAWLFMEGSLPPWVTTSVKDADELEKAAARQLADGSDLVKIYLDGPKPEVCPWSVEDVKRIVQLSHSLGRKVAAHSTRIEGARVGVEAGVDSIEHGGELDEGVARLMTKNGTFLVPTLSVLKSWESFASTTTIPRFTETESKDKLRARAKRWKESARLAHEYGVKIATGTDFGGGSLRANHLAWEVEALVEVGLEPWEALGAATWRAGELIGDSDAGVVREGGRADFFLVHGNPLVEPSALWRVWRVGWRR